MMIVVEDWAVMVILLQTKAVDYSLLWCNSLWMIISPNDQWQFLYELLNVTSETEKIKILYDYTLVGVGAGVFQSSV